MSPDPTPAPSPGSSGEVAAKPGRLCRLGQELEDQTRPHLDKALGDLQQTRGIGHGLFTMTHYAFAAAYVAAVEYVEEDLQSKRKDLAEIHQKLCTSGAVWAMAEDKSTLREV